MRVLTALLILGLPLGGCGYKLGYRHFAGPIAPDAGHASEDFVVGDDRSITFIKDRLEVSIVPLTSEELNRHFALHSAAPKGFAQPNPYTTSDNPYTYGDWKPPGEDGAPERFTVFLLKVKNYAFPKVQLAPQNVSIISANGWNYQVLSQSALIEYYFPYAVAYGGNARRKFEERTDILRRTLFKDEMVFSGQEYEGYIVFPVLDHNVEEFTIWIKDMALRFDFRGESVENVDIPFHFARETYYARNARTGAP